MFGLKQKFISSLFLFTLILFGALGISDCRAGTLSDAASSDYVSQSEPEESDTLQVDPRIKEELKASIESVYGQELSEEIYDNLIKRVKKAIENRPQKLKQQDISRASDWYKDEIIYMFYVNQFGVVQNNKDNTFNNTEEMFDYLQDLGVTTLYLLPFVDSPMEDAGFDVKKSSGCKARIGRNEAI